MALQAKFLKIPMVTILMLKILMGNPLAESKARMRTNRMPSSGSVGSSNPVGGIIAADGPESGRNAKGPSSITGTMEGTTGQGEYMYRNDDGRYAQTNDPLCKQGVQLETEE